MEDPLLLVLDGNGLAMRCIMAPGELNTSTGIPVGGLYRSIQMFNMLMRQFRATHVLWTFDHGRSSHRLAIFPGYKANRDERREIRQVIKDGKFEGLVQEKKLHQYSNEWED